MPHLLVNGPESPITVALAHGAGAPMDSPFMEYFAKGIAAAGFRVARFEFPYMAARRDTGRKPGPDREPKLRQAWAEVMDQLGREQLVIGGKSLGGRIASLMADESQVRGLVCLGYPFHPVGKPDRLRTEHLADLQTPTLIVQGERDPFGKKAEVPGYGLSSCIKVYWLPDGDHSFKPRKASGRTEEHNWADGVAAVAGFLGGLSGQCT